MESNLKYTLIQCMEAMERNPTTFYSTGTLWWTDDEADLEPARKLGVIQQEKKLNEILNNKEVPDEEKQRIQSLMNSAKEFAEKREGGGIPLDPYGCPLMQIDTKTWIDKGFQKTNTFGKYGMDALMQAHSKNTPAIMEGPFLNFQEVNEYIDEFNSNKSLGTVLMMGVDFAGNDAKDTVVDPPTETDETPEP